MLDTRHFDNRFTRELPADPQVANFRRQVHGACYSRVVPTPVAAPRLTAYSREVAELLDITPATCESPEFVQVFSGNKLLHGMDPFAMCYGGHQFGHWAGQLGDGRAIILGETGLMVNTRSVVANEAFPWDGAPRYLIRDRDRIYDTFVTRRMRAMGVRDKPTAPALPWQNGFAERLIRSIRRECVDHFIALGEEPLRRILRAYAGYYNEIRTHGYCRKMRRSRARFSELET